MNNDPWIGFEHLCDVAFRLADDSTTESSSTTKEHVIVLEHTTCDPTLVLFRATLVVRRSSGKHTSVESNEWIVGTWILTDWSTAERLVGNLDHNASPS